MVNMKLISHSIFLALLLFLFTAVTTSPAQKTKPTSQKLISDKPSVYISFERKGKQNALFQGESDERIWLRLNNNTKMKIFLCEFSVEKPYGDLGIFYTVERVSFFEEYRNTKTPVGYGQIDTCDVFTLVSGKSALFSVPAEHLAKGLGIRTQFYYGWTGDWKNDLYEGTTHFVGFGNDQLSRQEK